MISKNYQPGFSLVHRQIKLLMNSDQGFNCLDMTSTEADIVKRNLDDYVMYIWVHLGDTRYNRSGYRNAVDKLTQHLGQTIT